MGLLACAVFKITNNNNDNNFMITMNEVEIYLVIYCKDTVTVEKILYLATCVCLVHNM